MNGTAKRTTRGRDSCGSTRLTCKPRWFPKISPDKAGQVLGLAGFIFMGLGQVGPVQAALDCGLEPCPGTAPAIWADRSATVDGTVRILGWNLVPLTDYQIVVVLPDGSLILDGFVTTDAEGDFLGDDYDLTPEEIAQLNEGQPHVCVADPALTGVYQVRVYEWLWSGDLAEVPVASTTFLQK